MKNIIHTIESFKEWSNDALTESKRFKAEGDSYAEALQFGVHAAYKVAYEHLEDSVNKDREAGKILLPCHEVNTVEWLYGRPCYIEPTIDSIAASSEVASEGRIIEPRRVNFLG